MTFIDVLMVSMDQSRLHDNIPVFYQEILDHWYSTRRNPSNIHDVLDKSIWYNRHILVDKSSVFCEELYDKGIYRIKDLLNGNDMFMSA